LLDRRDRLGEVKRLSVFSAVLAIVLVAACKAPIRPRVAEPEVFAARCVVCHQKAAQGVLGVYPPLADSIGNYVRAKDGRDYLIHVVLGGRSGPVEVKGTTYYGLMPQFSQLSDAEIATALNQVLTRFNASEIPKDFAPITEAEVKRARAIRRSPTDLARERTELTKELQGTTTADGSVR
jgi:mono/diheme cytochrome c family protein